MHPWLSTGSIFSKCNNGHQSWFTMWVNSYNHLIGSSGWNHYILTHCYLNQIWTSSLTHTCIARLKTNFKSAIKSHPQLGMVWPQTTVVWPHKYVKPKFKIFSCFPKFSRSDNHQIILNLDASCYYSQQIAHSLLINVQNSFVFLFLLFFLVQHLIYVEP